MKFRAISTLLTAGLLLTGCRNAPLNPPRLVMDGPGDTTIQLFIQASILMSHYYGLKPIAYSDFRMKSESAGFATIPFVAPDVVRASSDLLVKIETADSEGIRDFLQTNVQSKQLVKYYIRTGLRASQLICRNHLTRLDEGNQYIEFLKREIGVASSFASGILALVNANSTLSKSFLIAVTGVADGMNAYQDYRYLSIDRDAARILVETAQSKLADYYLKQVDLAGNPTEIARYIGTGEAKIAYSETAGGYSFPDAINAVSTIEYQCTREGIRYLLNRSINNTPSNLDIDAATGTVMFKSAVVQTGSEDKATVPSTKAGQTKGSGSPGTIINARAYEKSLDLATIKRWQNFCGIDEDGQLGGPDSALRQRMIRFLKLPTTQTEIFTNDGKRMNDAIAANAAAKECAIAATQ